MKKLIKQRYPLLAKAGFAVCLLACCAQSAYAAPAAGTAANTLLENTVTANYKNAGGIVQAPETATAAITILLVEAQPVLALVSASASVGAEGDSITVNYTITSNANGEDDYSLTPSEALTNVSASIFTPSSATITLGATTVATAFTITDDATPGSCCTTTGGQTCAIGVPIDALVAGYSATDINGLVAGDLITFSDGAATLNCVLAAVTNGTVSTGTTAAVQASISVNNCNDFTGSFSLDVGDNVFEYAAVAFTTTLGNLTTAADGTTVVSLTGGLAGGASGTPVEGPTITVKNAVLKIYKFVRNTTTPTVGNAAAGTTPEWLTVDAGYGSATYYTAGVTAQPNDVLEYVVLVVNEFGSATDVVLTDPLQIFTTYAPGSLKVTDAGTLSCSPAHTCTVTVTGGTTSPADAAGGGDAGTAVGNTITLYAGVGGNEDAAAGAKGGTIAQGKVSVGAYRVTVE